MKLLYSLRVDSIFVILALIEFFNIFIYSYFIYIFVRVATNATRYWQYILGKELKNIVWYNKMLKCDQRNSIRFAVVSCNFRDIESLSTYCHVEIIHKISKCLWDRTIRF